MATVTRPPRSLSAPTAPAAEAQPAPEAAVLDAMQPHPGDRIALVIWVLCVLFMAALLTLDTLVGLLR